MATWWSISFACSFTFSSSGRRTDTGGSSPSTAYPTDTKIGTDLGLTNDWVVNIVKATGNYGELFERNVGSGSPLKIARGLNALWTKGGLQYAMPIR